MALFCRGKGPQRPKKTSISFAEEPTAATFDAAPSGCHARRSSLVFFFRFGVASTCFCGGRTRNENEKTPALMGGSRANVKEAAAALIQSNLNRCFELMPTHTHTHTQDADLIAECRRAISFLLLFSIFLRRHASRLGFKGRCCSVAFLYKIDISINLCLAIGYANEAARKLCKSAQTASLS